LPCISMRCKSAPLLIAPRASNQACERHNRCHGLGARSLCSGISTRKQDFWLVRALTCGKIRVGNRPRFGLTNVSNALAQAVLSLETRLLWR
jgi:hypothetical protein